MTGAPGLEGQVEDWGEKGLMRKTSGKRWMGK